MRVLREYIDPGKPLRLHVQGSYFRLIECGADVTIMFFKGGRDLDLTAESVGIGFWSKLPAGESFDEIHVFSTVGQLLRFGITRGEGGIDGSGAIANNGQTQGGAVNTDLKASVRATLKLMEPTLTDPDELDSIMGFFEPWPVSNTSQALYLLTGAIRDSAALLRQVTVTPL